MYWQYTDDQLNVLPEFTDDIVHFHSLTSAAPCFVPRLGRAKVVVTIHRLEWRDEKWGPIGRAKAVAQFGRIKIEGFLAWILWLTVHILFLVGFRNRFIVVSEWAFAYFTWTRGSRLIVGDLQRPRDSASQDDR